MDRDAAYLQLRLAANEIVQGTSDEHLRGDALLLLGRTDAAIDALRRAAADGDPHAWSDLSLGLIERGIAVGSSDTILDGLAAADRAVALDGTNAAAHFNAGVALETLGLTTEARHAFEKAAGLEQGSPWAAEARSRAKGLVASDPNADWKAIELRLRNGAGSELAARAIAKESGTARRIAEWSSLTSWASARLAGKTVEAQEALSLARVVAHALLAAHGERLLTDAIAAIDRAEARGAALDLARGHLAYDKGRTLLRASDGAGALKKFDEASAAFVRAGSPMDLLAKYYASGAYYSEARIDATLEKVLEIERAEPEKKGYRAVAAQMGWHSGICLIVRGRYTDAVAVFERSRALASQIHDALLTAQFDGLAAEAMEYLGQTTEAWRLRTRALRALSAQSNEQRKTVTLMTAANLQLAHREWQRCATILDRAVPLAAGLEEPVLATHTLSQRAIALEELGHHAAAEADRDQAAIWLQKITEPAVHERLAVELEIARGVALRNAAPASAVAHFDRAIRQFESSGERAHLPRLYLERGRAYEALGRADAFRADLGTALGIIESWGDGIEDLDKRAALNIWSETIRRDIIDLALRSGDVATAFHHAERGRSAGESLSLIEVRRELAPDAAIVEIVQTPRGVVAFVIRRENARALLLSASAADIAAAAGRARVPGAGRDGFEDLSRLILAPVRPLLSGAGTLLIVPDRELAAIPFGALYDKESDRFLGEDFAVLHAPSTAMALRLSRYEAATAERALVIGADMFDRALAEPLPSVGREATLVAAHWPRSVMLAGNAVTADALRRELPRATLVHYAGHILGHAAESRLLLSDGFLAVRDVTKLDLHQCRLVVLAACRGAARETSLAVL
ncbi:MAG TPA: CHAT domain-containing protein, partial [Thermoanaerobaculia bacterium]